MSDWLANVIPQVMQNLGYWGIGLLMFLENLFPPIPSELIMPLAGFTVAKGNLNFGLAVFAGVAGTILGAYPWYYLGKWVSEPRLRDWATRYGKWLTISGEDIDKANRWFNRHGGKAVFLCRLVPGIRTLISLPAGINNMPIAIFTLYSTLGTTIWVALLTYLGYVLGDNYEVVDKYLGPVSKVVILSLMVGFAAFVGIRMQKRKRRHLSK
ncbi:MAG TPA: DedA family protein [Leptolyngbyaceae cyanobacterium M33_DOE_097]|uniref:DedA family protein n=1 Tax=Oscillatoriales cyanobacterium SpSt-418 TaxID=2282169 RepID=A0A7C3KJ30_9CYAN|nr:DedA family protein [Leptolyngbyaceae cyanobacterium M33_DOE_097]